jgi:hypothetical protein
LLDAAGGFDAGADGFAGLAGGFGGEFLVFYGGDFYVEIDAVQ